MICVNGKPVEIDLNMLGSDGFNVLHVACAQANMDVVKYLLKCKELNPNVASKDDYRPLDILAENGLIEGVRVLIRHGKTDLCHTSSKGSVLHTAVKNKKFKICQILLIEEKSLINTVSPTGETVFDIRTSPEITKLLKQYNQIQDGFSN